MNKIPDIQNNDKSPRRGFFKKIGGVLAGASLISSITNAQTKEGDTKSINGGSDAYVGDILMVAFNYAPIGWVLCNGQLLAISEYNALIGTRYGGDGVNNFAVPNLCGRAPISQGQGTGLTNRTIGEIAGEEKHLLNAGEMAYHSHNLLINTGVGSSDSPFGTYPAKNGDGVKQFAASTNASGISTGLNGSSLNHNNMQPYLALNFIICTEGSFPQQSK